LLGVISLPKIAIAGMSHLEANLGEIREFIVPGKRNDESFGGLRKGEAVPPVLKGQQSPTGPTQAFKIV
jgi:hypothetical protein